MVVVVVGSELEQGAQSLSPLCPDHICPKWITKSTLKVGVSRPTPPAPHGQDPAGQASRRAVRAED